MYFKLIAFDMQEAVEVETPIVKALLEKLNSGQPLTLEEIRTAGVPVAKGYLRRDLGVEEGRGKIRQILEVYGREERIKTSGEVVLTPEEVLAMHRAGEMPPIGSWIKLAGGVVAIGNTFAGEGRNDGKPVHHVKISPFLISPYSVTNAEFGKFMEAGGYTTDRYWSEDGGTWKEENSIVKPAYWDAARFNQPNQPVVGVSWYEAEAYLKWANARFPTEHEWEYAGRGNLVGKRYPWGDEEPTSPSTSLGASKAHFNQDCGTGKPVEVNTSGFAPNNFGLSHMAGNVWQWVLDWYADNYYQKLATTGSIVENPKGPERGSSRVLRGGSWFSSADYLRVAYRDYCYPVVRDNSLGFRAARDL